VRYTQRLAASMTTAVVTALLGVALMATAAQAQTPDADDIDADASEVQGTISGTVILATAGATLGDELRVELVVLAEGSVVGTTPATVTGDRFEVEVPADLGFTFVPLARYQGVQYFADAVILSAEEPNAEREFTVYEATSDQPPLEIVDTIVTVVAIDRGTGELGVIREDIVRNATDRVYTGDGRGITLRLPAPAGTTEAAGENADGTFTLEEGVLVTTTPIRALSETSIITRYLINYDIASDEYELRITAPMDTGRILLRVPQDYTRALRLPSDAVAGPPDVVTTGAGTEVTLRTVILEDAAPGDSLVVLLDGFAPQLNENALTSHPGALIALFATLLVVGAGTGFALSRRPAGAPE